MRLFHPIARRLTMHAGARSWREGAPGGAGQRCTRGAAPAHPQARRKPLVGQQVLCLRHAAPVSSRVHSALWYRPLPTNGTKKSSLHAYAPYTTVATGGAIPKIQAFPSGACYHTSCAVEQLLRGSAHISRADHLKELVATMEQLAKSTPHTDRDSVQEAQQRLHRWLKEGDPLHTECILGFLEREICSERRTADGMLGKGGGITLTLPLKA